MTQLANSPPLGRRPLYETSADRERETAVIDRLSARFGAATIRFGVGSVCDVLLVQLRKPLRLIEIKVRKNASGAFPTYMLSRRKYDDLLAIGMLLKVPVSLCVRWTDRTGMLDLPAAHTTAMGG